MSFAARVGLEGVDLVVPVLPDGLRDELVDAHDQDVLVVRPVEDADAPLARRGRVDAPEVVVAQLLLRRDAEAGDPGALRVERADHLPDEPILAAGVERLEDDQQGLARLRPEALLEFGELLEELLEPILRGRLVAIEARRGGWIDLRQASAACPA